MAFRENLIYLRSAHNLTQERLAVLLGVSRQAISKWESGKAYPEMDKLLTMSEVFDCPLDVLVRGDVRKDSPIAQDEQAALAEDRTSVMERTSQAIKKSLGVAGISSAQDFTGYDEHWRGFSRSIALGVGAFIAGVAAALIAEGLLNEVGAGVVRMIALTLGAIAGLACIIPAGLERTRFRNAHPFIEDFYTHDDRKQGVQHFARLLVSGIAMILAGIAGSVVADEVLVLPSSSPWSGVPVMLGALCGVPLIIWGALQHARFNVDRWNHADEQEMQVSADQERREHLKATICSLIMISATIIALGTLWLVPVFLRDSDLGKALLACFWIPWPLGGLLCAVASLIIALTNPRE